MELTKERLRKILERIEMEHLEKGLIRIIEKEDFDVEESLELSARRIEHAYQTIYQILEGRLTPDEKEDLMKMVDLYAKGDRDLFFEVGFILGWKKDSPF